MLKFELSSTVADFRFTDSVLKSGIFQKSADMLKNFHAKLALFFVS